MVDIVPREISFRPRPWPAEMTPERLRILYVSPMPTSPPRSGAEARMHGLLSNLARRHEVTAVTLIDPAEDQDLCLRAMREHCREVVFVRSPHGRTGLSKRALQLRSSVSSASFERLLCTIPGFQETLDRVLTSRSFDVVNLEFPYQAHYRFRRAPAGARPPVVILDAHDIAYEIVRQVSRTGATALRRLYASLNWRKLRSDELAAFRSVDGVYACSDADRSRILADLPGARVAVVPNAADVDFFQPRSSYPPADGRTIVFFGLLSTVPNVDGVMHFLNDVWPRIAAARPDARVKVIGARPPPALLALASDRVEVTGLVADLRPHLASAAVLVVPLRLGSGTRLKIVEGMAMAKAIVSTTLGAEGIEVTPGRDILIADGPAAFADAVVRVLDDRPLAERLGRAGRDLAVARYSWQAAAGTLEGFARDLLRARESGEPRAA